MFVVTVVFDIDPEKADSFLVRVRRQARDSLEREAGCHRFDVATSTDDPARVLLYELYDDAAAFDAHLASGHFTDFDRAVAGMVRAKTVRTWTLDPG